MRARRGDFLGGGDVKGCLLLPWILANKGKKMVNYSSMIIVALAMTSLVMLVKYRSVSMQLAEELTAHSMSRKSLQDDLARGEEQHNQLTMEISKRDEQIKDINLRLKGTQDELNNAINTVQWSNNQIKALDDEKQVLNEGLEKLKVENSGFQNENKKLLDELAIAADQLEKTKAMADDSSSTLKDAQQKQEQLISDNTRLSGEVQSLNAELQGLKGELQGHKAQQEENQQLRQQLDAALHEAKIATERLRHSEAEKAAEEVDAVKNEKGEQEVAEPKEVAPEAAAIAAPKAAADAAPEADKEVAPETAAIAAPKADVAPKAAAADAAPEADVAPKPLAPDEAAPEDVADEAAEDDPEEQPEDDAVEEEAPKDEQPNSANEVAANDDDVDFQDGGEALNDANDEEDGGEVQDEPAAKDAAGELNNPSGEVIDDGDVEDEAVQLPEKDGKKDDLNWGEPADLADPDPAPKAFAESEGKQESFVINGQRRMGSWNDENSVQ